VASYLAIGEEEFSTPLPVLLPVTAKVEFPALIEDLMGNP
jgi:hypothetical protein